MPLRDIIWRLAAIVLAVTTVVFYCQGRGLRSRVRTIEAERVDERRGPVNRSSHVGGAPAGGEDGDPGAGAGTGAGRELAIGPSEGATLRIGIPPALLALAPAPGEKMADYRDRMVPVVQQLVEPQRQRVRDARRRFEEAARLDERQKAELDAAADQAAEAILDRALQGVLSGELTPPAVRPMTAIGAARDLLDAMITAEQRFRAGLSADQAAALAAGHFDFADYVLFATRWEQMLGLGD